MPNGDDFGDLADKAEELDGENVVSLGELFDKEFMREHTDFDTIEEFFEESPWTIENENDLEAIPDSEFDDYVSQHTDFKDGESMQSDAANAWAARQIGL